MEDLSQLASSGLPSLGGSHDNPSWNRSLRELKIASDSLWTQSTPGPQADSSALGTRQLPDLGRIHVSPNRDSQAKQNAARHFLRWEEANRKREIDILKSIVQKAEVSMQKKSQDMYEKQKQEDWEKRRDLWMKELVGTRNLGGSTTSELRSLGTALLEGNRVGVGPALLARPEKLSMNSNSPRENAAVHPEVVTAHLEIIKRMKSSRNFAEAARELSRVASSPSSGCPGNACYATALRLMSRTRSRQHLSPVELALATQATLSGQFDDFMIGKLRKANQPEAIALYKSPNANTVASFVSMELGVQSEYSLWPCLYYCKYLHAGRVPQPTSIALTLSARKRRRFEDWRRSRC